MNLIKWYPADRGKSFSLVLSWLQRQEALWTILNRKFSSRGKDYIEIEKNVTLLTIFNRMNAGLQLFRNSVRYMLACVVAIPQITTDRQTHKIKK